MEIEQTAISLEALKESADMMAQHCMALGEVKLYEQWDMFRLELGACIARAHDIAELEEVAQHV